jgi:hypothetical protein
MKTEISIEDYHAHPSLSKSKLDLVERSMAHYLNPSHTEKDYFNFGQAVHDSILMPELFKESYISMPETIKIRRGKEWDAFKADNAHKKILTRNEMEEVVIFRDKIMSHKICKNIFKDGEPEVSYFTDLEIDGETVAVKCRPDYVAKNCLIDIKTTIDGSYDAFKRAIHKYRYNVQGAFYLDVVNKAMGTEIDTFIFVTIEKSHPYPIGVYMLDRESIDLGRKQYQRNLKTIMEHRKNPREVQGYTDDAIQVIGCPNYAFYEEIS